MLNQNFTPDLQSVIPEVLQDYSLFGDQRKKVNVLLLFGNHSGLRICNAEKRRFLRDQGIATGDQKGDRPSLEIQIHTFRRKSLTT